MSHIQLTMCWFVFGMVVSSAAVAQENPDPRRWSHDPRTTKLQPTGEIPAAFPANTPAVVIDAKPRGVFAPQEVLTINPNVRVHPSTTTWQSEVPITRHPTNGNILYASSNAVHFSPSLFISEGMYLTTNGGITWFGSDTTAASPITGHSGDPAPVIGPDGRLYMSEITSSGMGVEYSTNMGQTWSNIYTLATGSQDKNHGFVNDVPSSPYYGYSYVTWSLFTASLPPAVVSYSSNGGVSWTSPITVLAPLSGHYEQGVNGAVGPNGDAYICWQTPVAGSPYTGDYVGFAKSTNGGATWSGLVNAYDCNGARNSSLSPWGIRINDFPSMAVDRSGGSRNGWIYIVTNEKNLSPAGSDEDIVMHRSTDGGGTWSAGIRVNQDALNNGKKQYMPWMCVDGAGGVNVVYYDNRNSSAGDSVEVLVSRSLDGGNTWTDIVVSDHRFKPAPISGLAGGYQGDYIGITAANGKIYPYWCDNSTGLYQAWVVSVATTENFGWVKGSITNVSGGAALAGVSVDFTESVPLVPGTSDGLGTYKVGARVDTPATTRNLTLRARKFGFRDTLLAVTITRNDTVVRNFAMMPVANGTLVVRTVKKDSSNIRSGVSLFFAGSLVSSGFTDSLTGIFSTSLPLGAYDIVVDPPSPFGTKRFNAFSIGSGTNQLYVVVREVVEASPAAMRDTLAVGQFHAKTMILTNTTPDTVPYHLRDDNTLARLRSTRPAIQPRLVPLKMPAGRKGGPEPMGPGQVNTSGGPDAFGYAWIDSDEPGGPVFNWTDITGPGTQITGWSPTSDDGYVTIPLPWSIPFYGNSYSTISVGTNGLLSFTSLPTDYLNTGIPAAAEPNNALYPLWDDLNLTSSGTVHYWNDSGNGRFVIQYTNVPFYSGTGTNTFQVLMYPNGDIVYQYLSMTGSTSSATVGVENADGTVGLQVVYNGTYIHNSLATKFYLPNASWISENPPQGRINPNSSQTITVTFDATGLATGTTYAGTIFMDLVHIDVAGPSLIPASLKVEPVSQALLILSKASVAFSSTPVNTTRQDSITARNGGAVLLTISSISSTNSRFMVTPSTAAIAPGDSTRIHVAYTPITASVDTGRVIILSNSQGEPRRDITLSGSGYGVPQVAVTPDSFTIVRPPGNDTTRVLLKVRNVGTDTVRYTLSEGTVLSFKGTARSVEQQPLAQAAKGERDGQRHDPITDGSGGPDAFGYSWMDSDEPGGPVFSWVDISTVGTLITTWNGTADDGYATVTLPFAFSLYGINYSTINIVTNGFVNFDTSSTAYTNTGIPITAAPNNALYAFWDDLDVRTSGTVHYFSDIPNQRFVVQYTNVPHFGTTEPGLYTFQVIIKQNGDIVYQYLSMQQTLNSATIGIENGSGTVALQVAFNASYVHDNLALRFTKDAVPWLSTGVSGGTISQGDSANVEVRVHPSGLTAGDYRALLLVSGNFSPPRQVPVHLLLSDQSSVTVDVIQGWNILSNPVNRPPETDSVLQLYPSSSFPYAFAFAQGEGYQQRFVMDNGPGYWLKIPSAAASIVQGTMRGSDTISVSAGWNLVGSISYAVDTASVRTTPQGIISSFWFGYPYNPAAQIQPGQGYWVKTSSPGEIMLQAGGAGEPMQITAWGLGMLSTLTVADTSGASQKLYFGDEGDIGLPLSFFDMPPVPPIGAFDARFESSGGGRLLETFTERKSALPIVIQSNAYPLTVSWKVGNKQSNYALMDGSETPTFDPVMLNDEGGIKISNPLVHRLALQVHSREELPTQYALAQNYPNPFNPETRIHFELPHDGPVQLVVYDLIGREVRTLVNETMKAGRYDVSMDAGGLASGVYFYRLVAPGYVGIRKLMVLK